MMRLNVRRFFLTDTPPTFGCKDNICGQCGGWGGGEGRGGGWYCTVDHGSCAEYVHFFLTDVIASSGEIQVKLGWLWTVNCKLINFCKRPQIDSFNKNG